MLVWAHMTLASHSRMSQAVPAGYTSNRKEWVTTAAGVQAALRLPNEVLATLPSPDP